MIDDAPEKLNDLSKMSAKWFDGLNVNTYAFRAAPRPSNDRKIQVWCNEKLIGTLSVSRSRLGYGGNSLDFAPPGEQRFSVSIAKRNVLITALELDMHRYPDELMRQYRMKYQIPEDATIVKEPMNLDTRISWWAINATIAQSELLFDLDEFEPADD